MKLTCAWLAVSKQRRSITKSSTNGKKIGKHSCNVDLPFIDRHHEIGLNAIAYVHGNVMLRHYTVRKK